MSMLKGLLTAVLAICFLPTQSQSLSEILADQKKRDIQVGDSAPDFILTVGDNSIRSFSVRRNKRITLLHFWNTHEPSLKIEKGHLLRLLDHYERTSYINASGFEIIAIAVQSDIAAWKEAISADSLGLLIHGMAVDSIEDLVCKNYSIKSLPSEVLIDEKGIVIAINPRMVDIENMLEERKSYQPIRKELHGIISHTSNKNDVLRNGKLRVYNYYGDSLTTLNTNAKGEFFINDLKLNQDFVLKVDVRDNVFLTSEPIAIFNKEGEFVMEGKNTPTGFIFEMAPRLANQILQHDDASKGKHEIEEIDVIKSLRFTDNGRKLTSKDEKELNIIVFDMQKNPELYMEFVVHTDSKVNEITAMEITSNQVNAIKDYFQKKGLDLCHITGIAKGNSEMRKLCLGNADCTEEEHKLNRRVEFILFKITELTE